MGKNDLARRLQDMRQKGLKEGLAMGQQFTFDMIEICLHRQGWGYDRIKRLRDSLNEISNYYADAFINCMEQDVRQEQLDRELQDILKDREPFTPFAKRYPNVITLGYEKLPRM